LSCGLQKRAAQLVRGKKESIVGNPNNDGITV
jgi:hypothetical protein